MLTCWPVSAPHAHAKLLTLETTLALKVPGVVTVLTSEDVPGKNDTGPVLHDEIFLPTDEVFYWGQPVAWVVAETEDAARQGQRKLRLSTKHSSPFSPLKGL